MKEPAQPFLLWTSSAKAFGKAIVSELTKGLPPTPYEPRIVPDFSCKTSKKRKVLF
jgi:hypothetical protein